MKKILKVMFVSAVAVWIVLPRHGRSCAPDFPRAIFVRPHGPDRPMTSFAGGKLGIVLPTWWRAYLLVAYRYLESKPLSPEEQHSLLERWDVDRALEPNSRTSDAIAKWVSARRLHTQSLITYEIGEFKNWTSEYYQIENCQAPAFTTAIFTLEDRAHHFGATSRELQEWIRGQDTVFGNCGGGNILPAQLPASANPLLRADRAYQIAASRFYSGEFEAAIQDFKAIAGDLSSPWHDIASYLIARTLIRIAAKTAQPDFTYNPIVLAQAETWLKQIVGDPKQRAVRKDAQSLLSLVVFHLHPEQRQHELGRLLARGGTGSSYGQDLRDYTFLLDHIFEFDPDFPGIERWTPEYEQRKKEWNRNRYSQLKPQRSDDLTDWAITMQWEGPAARDHAIAKWKSTQSVPWLVAALGRLKGGDAEVGDLMNAAAEISPTSAAYATVAYHRIRLARESGDYQLARKVLKEALAPGINLPPSAVHLLQDEQMMAAADFKDFLAFLWQRPLLFDYGENYPGNESVCYDSSCAVTFFGVEKPATHASLLPQFSPVAASLLNTKVPLEFLVRVVESSSLPENLRRRVAPATWARAALLDQLEYAGSVVNAAVAAQPGLRIFIEAYGRATTPEERHFAAVFTVLHFPGLRPFVDDSFPRTTAFHRIDDYRDNWWCGDVGGITGRNNYAKINDEPEEGATQSGPTVTSPDFLTQEEKQQVAKEWKKLNSFGSSARYLPSVVVDWAAKHPDDPRVPEALHLAVRATRFACTNERPSDLSRQAFDLLHKNYPKSDWAERTPFWY
jgi:hypothetical protein